MTVIAVELLNAPGLRLTNATFVPGGAVGDGFDYGDLHALTFPAAWASRQSIPHAELTKLTATKSPVDGAWSKDPSWQLVVGIIPVSETGGFAKQLRIRYVVGGHTYRVTGKDSVGILSAPNGCSAALGLPG